ncbi:hypothetical protein niasHT_018546 [Heterodera trifolii]|uniref:Uncharacterized protein n=1 Tax=Heterodera trifolii TaxID=157864 RepID=A0ABD2L3U8_9BILA
MKTVFFLISLASILLIGKTARLPNNKKGNDANKSDFASTSNSADQTQNKQIKTTDDAWNFLKIVKQRFVDNPSVFSEFLSVMRSFKDQKVDSVELHQRVAQLFTNETDLMRAFESFMPGGPDYEIPKVDQTQEDAVRFVKRVKERFASEPDLYNQFLHHLKDYKTKKSTLDEVYLKVSRLFVKEKDLLNAFASFILLNNSDKDILAKLNIK